MILRKKKIKNKKRETKRIVTSRLTLLNLKNGERLILISNTHRSQERNCFIASAILSSFFNYDKKRKNNFKRLSAIFSLHLVSTRLLSAIKERAIYLFVISMVSKLIALNFVSRFKISLEIFVWRRGFCLYERRVFLSLRVFEFVL